MVKNICTQLYLKYLCAKPANLPHHTVVEIYATAVDAPSLLTGKLLVFFRFRTSFPEGSQFDVRSRASARTTCAGIWRGIYGADLWIARQRPSAYVRRKGQVYNSRDVFQFNRVATSNSRGSS